MLMNGNGAAGGNAGKAGGGKVANAFTTYQAQGNREALAPKRKIRRIKRKPK